MSRNKETANYGELDVQLMGCMDEIKHKPEEQKEYDIPKFAQILVGDEYIKELRKKHREEELKGFWRPYIQRVLEVYAPDDEAQKLLFAINGFLEEYRSLGIEQRRKKYAKEIERSPRTVRNKEKVAIKLVVEGLYYEIQENDRHNLKLYADEVFAALDSAKPVPSENLVEPGTSDEQENESRSDNPIGTEPDDVLSKRERDKRKFLKWLSEHIVAILILLVMISQIPSFQEKEEAAGEDSPEIISFSVRNQDIYLVPGGQELIDVDVYPDEADKSRLSTVSQNPEIAWTEHLLVNADENIQDEEQHSATIIVQTGRIDPVNVNVIVKNPEAVEQYNIDRIGTGTNLDNGGDN